MLKSAKPVVVSGIQPSGNPHLGNYLGAIMHWPKMQQEYQCFFFLADLHALTTHTDVKQLQQSVIESAALYVAAGLDPDKSVIFAQSSVPAHTQLAWMFNCLAPIGWLQRMTQFKDKAGNQATTNTGILTYPLLMAADILLYQADIVPVGEDQKQHLELTRDVAELLNRKFNQQLFKLPEPLIQGAATRVMSLRDGLKKMSKSAASDASRVNLTDSAEVIISKVKKAKTDSIAHISFEPETRPEIANLINIYCALSNLSPQQVVDNYHNQGCAKFKADLAEIIIENLRPINAEYQRLSNDKAYIINILKAGQQQANNVASRTYQKIHEAWGLLDIANL